MRLDEAPIPAEHRAALKRLGYLSVEQVLSAAATEPARIRMNNYLKADVTKALAAVGQRPPLRLSAKAQAATYTFGARLKQPVKAVMPQVNLAAAAYVPTERRAALPKAAAFGSVPDVNLEPEMPPVRDQAYRGTCVAHAAVADFEHYLISNGDAERDTIDLSEQFLYWNCKQHDGEPSEEGTMLSVAMPLLVTDGCCLETTWPYNPQTNSRQ
jgi:C1A family cysteine protease